MKLQYSLLLLVLPATAAQAAAPLEEIVARALARDEAIHAALEKYEYGQSVKIEKLDADGKVTGTESLDMVVRPGLEGSYAIVTDGKGGAFIPGDATDRQKKIARDSEKNKTTFTLRKLAERYDLAFEGEGALEDRPAYLVKFSPKPGQPYHDRNEKVLNHLTGTIWVDRGDYSILQTKAVLAEPVELAWFFATMKSLTFDYRTQATPAGRAPQEFNLAFQVEVPFRTIRQRQFITMRDYRPRS